MLVVVRAGTAQRALLPLVPLVEAKTVRDGLPTAYVCEHGTCKLPTTDPDVLARLLAETAPLPPG